MRNNFTVKYIILAVLLSVLISLPSCSYIGESDDSFENKMDETADYIAIQHKDSIPTQGLLFYPGGLVDAGTYKPWCDHLISAQPQLTIIIIKMPLNLAVFSPEKGLKYKAKYNNIQHWIIGGHSLGGSMAARVVHNHTDEFSGLLFLGAYPAESDNLSQWNGHVLSLSAEHDGLCTPDKIEQNKPLLPTPHQMISETDFPNISESYTAYYQIPGANHAQFGNYGPQKKDGEATISRAQQHQIMVNSIQAFIHILWP